MSVERAYRKSGVVWRVRWRDELGGEITEGGEVRLAALLAKFPVAVLLPEAL